MKTVIIYLFTYYYFIGTLFLMMFLLGYLTLDMKHKKTGKELHNPTSYVVALCFYWLLLVYLLKKTNWEE